jgi:hypothetical protein
MLREEKSLRKRSEPPPPSGPRTHSTRLDLAAQALVELMEHLQAVADRDRRRELSTRVRECSLAVERWMLSEDRSEEKRAETLRAVLELRVEVLAAAGRGPRVG